MSSRDEIGPDPRTATLWARIDHEHDMISTRLLGFWLYMLSDSLIFAALFAAYGVLSYENSLASGPGPINVVSPYRAYIETVVLLTSVLAYGLAMVELKRYKARGVVGYMIVSLLFGLGFLGLEWQELSHLAANGAAPQRSGYLSIFFTLIAVHGIHIAIGLVWMVVAAVQVARQGLTVLVVYRLANLKVFWVYQALVWTFVFTFIYLRGAIP
jgi:cytochrome o ubiquinol oxidase subunit 3